MPTLDKVSNGWSITDQVFECTLEVLAYRGDDGEVEYERRVHMAGHTRWVWSLQQMARRQEEGEWDEERDVTEGEARHIYFSTIDKHFKRLLDHWTAIQLLVSVQFD